VKPFNRIKLENFNHETKKAAAGKSHAAAFLL
jgi:hypothetical protein